MAKDPPSPSGEEAAENAGPSRKESDPLFQQLGLKRRTTVIGLAPAPHLIAKAAANMAAKNAPNTGPPAAPLHEEIEEPQLPPPAFGQTTMLMTPQTPAIPLSLPNPNPNPAGRAPDTDPSLPPDDGWGSGERQEQKPAGIESSPTILVEPPKGGAGSGSSPHNQNVVHGFGGRVTPQGIQPAHVGPRPHRSDPPTGTLPGSDPPPNTQRHQNQNQNQNQNQTLNQNPPGGPPGQGQQQPSTLHMKVAPSVSRQTQPLAPPNPNAGGSPHSVAPNQPPQHQQQQPYRPPHQSQPSYQQPPYQQPPAQAQPQPQPQIQPQQIHNIEPRRPSSSRPEPNEVIAEVVARHPSYPLMRTPVQPDWPPQQQQQQSRALGERWKPRYPVVTGGDAPLGMATKQQVDGFRELRTRLQSIAAGTQRTVFTTLVVPLTSGSGGSFVARNLATAFAFGNERDAILVDCNIEKPTQHLMLRSRPDAGLFEFLEQPNSRPIDSIVQPTTIPRLHLIPAGNARLRFQEHFSSPQMRALIETIQSESFVFLDGPAAKGSPDARILSKLADFVILVVGYGRGTADDVAQAAAMFEPTKFAGVVFNERE